MTLDEKLDEALRETFPASDAFSLASEENHAASVHSARVPAEATAPAKTRPASGVPA